MRMYGGPNGYGHAGFARGDDGAWSQIVPGPVRTSFAVLWAKFQGADPIDLRKSVVILNQKQTSSCTGHAEVGAASTAATAGGNPFPYPLSAWAAYRLGLMIDADPVTALVDQGAIPEQVTRGCQEWGLPSFADDPTPDGADTSSINVRPSLGELEKGLRLPITGIYGVSGESQLQASLTAGFPVKFATMVDTALEEWTGGDPIGPPDPTQILGGHALYFVHWELIANRPQYWFANSWDVTWGEGGFGRVSSAFVQQATDFEVVKYGRAAA